MNRVHFGTYSRASRHARITGASRDVAALEKIINLHVQKLHCKLLKPSIKLYLPNFFRINCTVCPTRWNVANGVVSYLLSRRISVCVLCLFVYTVILVKCTREQVSTVISSRILTHS